MKKKRKKKYQPQILLTLRGLHGLAMLSAPAQGMEVCCHNITPKVGTPVILVSLIPKKQQLATCGDDAGHPVRVVRLWAHTDLQLHAWAQPCLKALVYLRWVRTQELNLIIKNTKNGQQKQIKYKTSCHIHLTFCHVKIFSLSTVV